MAIQPVRGRVVADGQQVAVYRNSDRHCWSILTGPGGVLLGHAYAISLHNCRFTVNKRGHRVAVIEGRDVPHAYVVGTYQPFGRFGCPHRARYDIQRGGFFTILDERIETAAYVDLLPDGMRVEKINEN